MTEKTRIRLARLRDLVLGLVATACALLSGLLLGLHSMKQTRNLLWVALEGRTITLAVALGALALAAGAVYVFLPPPCQPAPDKRIRG